MNVSTINSFMNDVKPKEVKTKQEVEIKSNESFKSIIDSKKANKNDSSDKPEAVETNDEAESSEVKEPLDKLEGKSEKLKSAIESGNETEIIEELVDILSLLNIEIVDNTKLPLAVEIPKGNFDITAINNSENNDTLEMLVSLLGDDNLTNLSEEMLDDVKNLIDMVVPLVDTNKSDQVKKNDIIMAIKNMLESADVEETDVTKVENNKTLLKEFNTNDLLQNKTSSDDLSDEDKILNKLLGIESDAFSQSVNRLTGRSDMTVQNNGEVSTVHKETMDADIIKNVRFMIKNEIQELKVKIYPKELGEMTIKILSEEGIMKAEIKATSKETYNLLNSNINEIKKSLSNENIKIQDVNISLYEEDTTYYNGQGFREKSNEESRSLITNDNRISNFDNEEEIEENINLQSLNVDLLV